MGTGHLEPHCGSQRLMLADRGVGGGAVGAINCSSSGASISRGGRCHLGTDAQRDFNHHSWVLAASPQREGEVSGCWRLITVITKKEEEAI